jgi:hypothetical protein
MIKLSNGRPSGSEVVLCSSGKLVRKSEKYQDVPRQKRQSGGQCGLVFSRVGRLVERLDAPLVSWLVGQMANLSVGQMVSWSVDHVVCGQEVKC